MGARTRGLANNVLSSGKLNATDAITGTIAAGNIANDSLTSATTYGSITGGVPAVASDPPSTAEGDIWYNTATGNLRFAAQAGSWATGGNLNTARLGLGSSINGTQTSTIAFGGGDPTSVTNNESYNGTSWTEVNDLNTLRRSVVGAGTATSALALGGYEPSFRSIVESWNGTSFTEIADLSNARAAGGSTGNSNTSALITGGGPGAPSLTESWNGSSWTEVGDLNTGRATMGHVGTQTAALIFGGYTPTPTGATESWNGTAWTEVNDLNQAKTDPAGEFGTSTSAVCSGGTLSGGAGLGNTELWNGTSWAENTDLSTARGKGAGSGTSSSGLTIGGSTDGSTDGNATEEWSFGLTNLTVG